MNIKSIPKHIFSGFYNFEYPLVLNPITRAFLWIYDYELWSMKLELEYSNMNDVQYIPFIESDKIN